MKKLLALLTAFILLLGFCAGAEEAEPVFATLGQAMEEAEFEGNIGGDGTYWVVVVVKDGAGDVILRPQPYQRRQRAVCAEIGGRDCASDILKCCHMRVLTVVMD